LDEYASKTVTYNGKEMSVYEASQIQRKYERQIRYWKRRYEALNAAGQGYSVEAVNALNKVAEYQAKMRDFIRQTNLSRQAIREQI